MKRLFLAALVLAVTTTGCAVIGNGSNPYERPQFYERYLHTGSTLDVEISRTLAALRQTPGSPALRNQLGTLLVERGFPKDAEREFERAVNARGDYYPAWYNLGLIRAARGDELGARRAFARTVDLKPGHAIALFQLGLIEEQRRHIDRAVDLYAKALSINPALLDVEVNPRILDTDLVHLALLRLYPTEHARESMQFQYGVMLPSDNMPDALDAPSPQERPQDIVTPAPPTTDPAMQPTPPEKPPSH